MKTVMIYVFVLYAIALMANPAPYRMFSEYWFDDEGDMFIELAFNEYTPQTFVRLRFTDGSNNQVFMDHYQTPSYNQAIYFNLSEKYPELELNQNSGQLTIDWQMNSGQFINVGSASWNSAIYSMSGKSHVAVYDTWDGYFFWAIESPPTPGTLPFQALTRCPLTVNCIDQNGYPVPGALVLVQFASGGYTDSTGVFSTLCYCCPSMIIVKNPQTHEYIHLNQYKFLPDSNVEITVTMNITSSNDDNVMPSIPIKGFETYPNPFIGKKHRQIALSFDGDQKVLSGAEVIVYNLRGQEVVRIPMQAHQDNFWEPDAKLPSGSYLLKLINGTKIFGSNKIRIIN